MLVIRRVAEIIIQLPLEECLELHNEALARGQEEDPATFEKAQKTLTDSRRMLEAMINVKLSRIEIRANKSNQENIHSALASAAWVGILSRA